MSAASSCGSHLARILLIKFNLFFVMTGVALLMLCIWALASSYSFQSAASTIDPILGKISRSPSAWGVLLGGAALFLVPSVLGSCGAALRRPCLLSTYAVIVAVGLLIQVSGGVLLTMYRKETDAAVRGVLSQDMRENFASVSDGAVAWGEVFSRFQCCGINNASDFTRSTGLGVPASCCIGSSASSQQPPSDCPETDRYPRGCWSVFLDKLHDFRDAIGGAIIALTTGEILMIVSSVYLARLAVVMHKIF